MNIAIDIRCLTEQHRTGVGEYTYELLTQLFEQDSENTYYLFYNSYKDVSGIVPKFEYKNVYVISSRWPNKLFSLLVWLWWIKLDLFIEKKCTKYNLTIRQLDNFTLDYFFAPNISFISLSENTKLILTIHDLSFKLFKDLYSWKRRMWHWFVSPKKLAGRAIHILTPSYNTKRDVARVYGIEENHIQVISPGVSSLFASSQNIVTIQKKYHLPEQYILCLGTLEPRKNIITLLESYALLPKKLRHTYPLVIAGGRGWKDTEIVRAIDNTPGVHYIGYIDAEDKYTVYHNATLFVFLSLYEGFGIPVLEAMHAGIPVIASNRPALTEVGGGTIYTVNPNNCNDIARAIEQILNESALRDTITVRQHTQARQFSWEESARLFLKVINDGE